MVLVIALHRMAPSLDSMLLSWIAAVQESVVQDPLKSQVKQQEALQYIMARRCSQIASAKPLSCFAKIIEEHAKLVLVSDCLG